MAGIAQESKVDAVLASPNRGIIDNTARGLPPESLRFLADTFFLPGESVLANEPDEFHAALQSVKEVKIVDYHTAYLEITGKHKNPDEAEARIADLINSDGPQAVIDAANRDRSSLPADRITQDALVSKGELVISNTSVKDSDLAGWVAVEYQFQGVPGSYSASDFKDVRPVDHQYGVMGMMHGSDKLMFVPIGVKYDDNTGLTELPYATGPAKEVVGTFGRAINSYIPNGFPAFKKEIGLEWTAGEFLMSPSSSNPGGPVELGGIPWMSAVDAEERRAGRDHMVNFLDTDRLAQGVAVKGPWAQIEPVLEAAGATVLKGDPSVGQPYAWVYKGAHLIGSLTPTWNNAAETTLHVDPKAGGTLAEDAQAAVDVHAKKAMAAFAANMTKAIA